MQPILLIHGYSSEGSNKGAEAIYGSLPDELRKQFGTTAVLDLNLSRWISLNDGISIDDISFAMERALRKNYPQLLESGFNVIIHSTGALVVRNWIKLFSPKPCPINNFVHLAGANFGSGLAHIGKGQLARWGRKLSGTGRGVKVLNELEFGSWKTIDLHRYLLQPGSHIYEDYKVQEFCIIGSQTLKTLRHIPIRYLKEDSSDNTVRTSSSNLNFNYLVIEPNPEAHKLSLSQLKTIIEQRQEDQALTTRTYQLGLDNLADARPGVPYTIVFETAHFGDRIGILNGSKNRKEVIPLLVQALKTESSLDAYSRTAQIFEVERIKTFKRAEKLKWSPVEWDKQKQYEGHAQVIFRIKDQFGTGIKDFDVTLRSSSNTKKNKLEAMLEDKHLNRQDTGTITFYLRTQKYDNVKEVWDDLLDDVAPLTIEITAHEDKSDDIDFVPLNIKLSQKQLQQFVQSFRTTIVDVTMLRLPKPKVFSIKKAAPT